MSLPRITSLGRVDWLRKRNGPFCVAKVRVDRLSVADQNRRVAKVKRLGTNFNECSLPAEYKLHEMPLCKRHAGEAALAIMMAHHHEMSAKKIVRELYDETPTKEPKE